MVLIEANEWPRWFYLCTRREVKTRHDQLLCNTYRCTRVNESLITAPPFAAYGKVPNARAGSDESVHHKFQRTTVQ